MTDQQVFPTPADRFQPTPTIRRLWDGNGWTQPTPTLPTAPGSQEAPDPRLGRTAS